ncbi:MAG: SDR family NAD(P)-dependent oxidoreductase [Nitrospina sp.]|jgi:NADP-dependent 3-hydroxy acid dehydrogenase YdfG|nr:SDR family NAD(P)-dependent oxidoreductase [Nitrospina sp.]MBT3855446.1 SDR family NAD(P)-dependent oxidoreductase [Nitrospina sp.]MBT4105228.1 SDR family NAD(P)-dependent oxidoreductase [Nitrospina sp.]MBT4390329.1 SDR family NAD(P)-dependent oxidoreductase [Nitrospina sp.]MBT4622128.1 SDR family NAD(P)-dependent oxidoreductase [Nitrospina sp.]
MTYKFAAISGASSGIGRSVALKMARENVSVAIFARRIDKLENLAEEIKALNPHVKVFPFQGDVRDKDSVERFFNTCELEFGPLDIFVNNAGIAYSKPFTHLDGKQVQDLIETNFSGSIWSIYHAMRLFEKRNTGALINISSTTILKASQAVPLYAATKLGVAGLIRSLEEKYLTNKDIKIINIIPGPTLTDLVPGTIGRVDAESMISPDDIAHWIWLAINSPKNCKVSNLVLRNSGVF